MCARRCLERVSGFGCTARTYPAARTSCYPGTKWWSSYTGAFGMRTKGARGRSYRARGKSFGATSRRVTPRATLPLCSRCTIKGGECWWSGSALCVGAKASSKWLLRFQLGWKAGRQQAKLPPAHLKRSGRSSRDAVDQLGGANFASPLIAWHNATRSAQAWRTLSCSTPAWRVDPTSGSLSNPPAPGMWQQFSPCPLPAAPNRAAGCLVLPH